MRKVAAKFNFCLYPRVTEITRILHSIQQGDDSAPDRLMSLVYDELRRIAAAKLARELPGQTLQPTALVHEAWLRLGADSQPQWQNRAHFFAAAAEAMRRILIEQARRKQRLKRGAEFRRIDFSQLDLASDATDEQLLALDEALQQLAARNERAAELIKLRFFVGLSNVDAAEILGIPERSAKRLWAYGRAWLLSELTKAN